MKKTICLLAVCGALTTGISAFAQMGGPQMPDTDHTKGVARFFGDKVDFTATLLIKVAGGESNGTELTVNQAMLGGKTRTAIDFTKMKSPKLKASDIAQMKEMGMDTMVIIARPDKKVTYQVYPGLNGYLTTRMADAAASDTVEGVDKEVLGTETVNGKECTKSKYTVRYKNGKKEEFLVWTTQSMGDFPVQLQVTEGKATTTTTFTDVKKEKPDAKLFEPPADCEPYNGFMEMMMQKMMR